MDAEAAAKLCSRGSVERLAALPEVLASGTAEQSGLDSQLEAAALSAASAVALQQAQQAAATAARLVAVLLQLLPSGMVQFEQEALLSGLVGSFCLSCQLSRAPRPAMALPEVCALRGGSRSMLAPLLDAMTLLLQGRSWEEQQLHSCCHPKAGVSLAAEVAEAMVAHASVDHLTSSCSRLLSVVLSSKPRALAFLGQEAAEAGVQDGAAAVAAASAATLATQLMDRFIQSCSGETRDVAALRGLLAYSHAAKAVAVEVSLHASLVEACTAMAASLSKRGHAGSSKRQQLKKQRLKAAPNSTKGGGGVHFAFGSRTPNPAAAPCSRLLSSNSAGTSASPVHRAAAEEGVSASQCLNAPGDGSSSPEQTQQAGPQGEQQLEEECSAALPKQRLLVCCDLLVHLALDSEPASGRLAAVGLVGAAAGPLWDAGTAHHDFMLALLELLRNVFANSQDARKACASGGEV